MTRTEAKAIWLSSNGIIDGLEKLGLLKFEDEEVLFYDKNKACYGLQWLKNLVAEKGYKIVRNQD